MRRLALPLLVALLLALGVRAAPAQEVVPTDLEAALEVVKATLDLVQKAEDEEQVAVIRQRPEMEGFALEQKSDWENALRNRQSILEKWISGRRFRADLPESETAARQRADRLARQIEAETERDTSFASFWAFPGLDPTEADVQAWEAAYTLRQAELREAFAKYGRAEERLQVARSDEARRELARYREMPPLDPAASPLAKFAERTQAIDVARFQERLERETEPLLLLQLRRRELERDLARIREQKAAQELDQIRKKLAQVRGDEERRKREEAAGLEAKAKAEADPLERHALGRRAAVARQEAEIIADTRALDEIKAQHERERQTNERIERALQRLRERYSDNNRSSAGAASSLLSALGRARTGRAAVRTQDLPRVGERLRQLERRRDAAQDLMWDLDVLAEESPAEWLALRDELIEHANRDGPADEPALEAAIAGAARRYDGLASYLRRTIDRLDQIEQALTGLRGIESLYFARIETHDDTETFVLRRILWLRTADPIGLHTIEGIVAETTRAASIVAGRTQRVRLAESYQRAPAAFVFSGVAIVGLTVFSFWLVRRLTGFRTGWRYRGGPALVAVQKIAVTIVLSALAPGCLALAALVLEVPDLPEEIAAPARRFLIGVAVIFYARRFLNSMLRPDGLARTELGAREDVAAQLLRASTQLWAVALFTILPYVILTADPFRFVHLPTAIAVVALVFLALIVNGLIRPTGALLMALTGGSGFWHQSWTIVSPFVRLGVLGIPVMFALGYQEGAKLLVVNVLQTIAAALVLISLYSLLTRIIETTARRVRVRQYAEEDASARQRSEEVTAQLTRVLGIASVVAAIVLLSSSWGFGDRATAMLDAVEITTINAEAGTSLTLKHVVAALLLIAATHFVIRNLPGIYEATLFTRIKVDEGSRFVIQTISRYLIFVVGYSAAVLSVQLDFQSLAWILAGASIGIGFGLQEIVSNFVSGLILLFERPIRVGDIIAVGTSEGTVRKINIRSTELESFDRLVLIIPNRRFISEDVVNWTRNDSIRRMQRMVGITYAEDISRAVKAVEAALQGCPWVLRDPRPDAIVWEFADSSMNLRVRFFVRVESCMRAQSEVLTAIHQEFRLQGIEIPFPQRDLHVRSIDADAIFRTTAPVAGPAVAALPEGPEPGPEADDLDLGDTITGADDSKE